MGYDAAGTTMSVNCGGPPLAPALAGTVTSPAVRLSPKARNRVRESCGIGVTVTVKVQEAEADAASEAVHCTSVAPTPNADPDGRVQLTVTGSIPPLVVGAV